MYFSANDIFINIYKKPTKMFNPQIDNNKNWKEYNNLKQLTYPILICYDSKTKLPIELK